MFDAHIHSSVSFDSSTPRAEMAKASAAAGVTGLCFTDHYDIVDADGAFVPEYDWSIARREQNLARECVGESMILNYGVELGNAPYDFAAAEKALNAEKKLDFVLGSIHNAGPELGYMDYYYVNYTDENICYKYLDDYFKQLERLVAWGNFDSLAHLPYPLRYMMERDGANVKIERYQSCIDNMLKTLIKNGQALEVNAGKSPNIVPEYGYLLDRYRALGGTLVTVGTDAHKPSQAGVGLRAAYELLLEKGFDTVAVFKRRKNTQVSVKALLES